MELYWKIRSSLYADSLRYKLIQKIYVMYSNNCTQLEVYTVLMIRTCTAVGCNYYEFELLAARSYRMQSDRHVWRPHVRDGRGTDVHRGDARVVVDLAEAWAVLGSEGPGCASACRSALATGCE